MQYAALATKIAVRRGRESLLTDADLLNQDAQLALLDVVTDALEDDDLTLDEVDAALEVARAGKFLKSSEHLARELEKYRLSHFTAA